MAAMGGKGLWKEWELRCAQRDVLNKPPAAQTSTKKGQDFVTPCSSSNNRRMASLKGLPESRTCRKGLQPLDASCNRQLSCLTAHVGVGFLFCSIRLYQMKGKNLF